MINKTIITIIGLGLLSIGCTSETNSNDKDEYLNRVVTPTTIKQTATIEVNTDTCATCHGIYFEKRAMGISKIVKDMKKEEIVIALNGYKAGTYGGNLKALMAGQVMRKITMEDIQAIAGKFGQ